MSDLDFMKFALELAKRTKGQTSPNPMVGAVVVKDGEIVGFGAHLKAGGPHAEVHAINMAKDKAKGSTVYVTLEPCSHYGKTPPCSKLLVESGVSRVVIATTDSNPLVAGKGIEMLEKHGIDVDVGVLKDEADKVNHVFFHFIEKQTPFVTLKAASSLDGKTATRIGESKWITGEAARRDVHQYRNDNDAILVGINTVLKDNPSLTTRLPYGGRNPVRIILDSKLQIPLNANVITDRLAPTWVVTSAQAEEKRVKKLEALGIKVIQMAEQSIDLSKLLSELGTLNIMSLFVEGGSEVHGSFIKQKLFNQIIIYLAPKLIGGRQSPTVVGGEGFDLMKDVISLNFDQIEKIGDDIKIIATP